MVTRSLGISTKTRYGHLEHNLTSPFFNNLCQSMKNLNLFQLKRDKVIILWQFLSLSLENSNYYYFCLQNTVQPNHTTSKKIFIFLSNIEYNLLNKHVEYSDQKMGAGQLILGNKDIKFTKICTIILIGAMNLALKAEILEMTFLFRKFWAVP